VTSVLTEEMPIQGNMAWLISSILVCAILGFLVRAALGRLRHPQTTGSATERPLSASPASRSASVAPAPDEDDARFEELRRLAQAGSVSWGPGRFAVEIGRREHEERMTMPVRARSGGSDNSAFSTEQGLWGPVDEGVADLVIASAADELVLRRSVPTRHPDVPRPSTEDVVPRAERRRGREGLSPSISPSELARMTPAARRLYGLE
jgi:hypothetical protein